MNRTNKNMESGFTLVELMIVVAIMGILAVIVVPAYQDYSKRSHISEGMNLAADVKSAVVDYYTSQGAWPANNTEAGLPPPLSITGNAVTSISVQAGGGCGAGGVPCSIIRVNFNDKVANNSQLIFLGSVQGGSIDWVCRSTTGASTAIPGKYLPAACR